MGVNPKIGRFSPKMDGLFHGKPYQQMDDLVGFPIFLVQHPHLHSWWMKYPVMLVNSGEVAPNSLPTRSLSPKNPIVTTPNKNIGGDG